jgi:hypothetical protein
LICQRELQEKLDAALLQNDRLKNLRDLEDYSRGEITLSRLSEILGQSPPVLRALLVQVGKVASGKESEGFGKPLGTKQKERL